MKSLEREDTTGPANKHVVFFYPLSSRNLKKGCPSADLKFMEKTLPNAYRCWGWGVGFGDHIGTDQEYGD